MSDLADKIIAASALSKNTQPSFFGIPLDLPEIDECGLRTMDTLDYFVARMLSYNYKFDKDGRLHLRDDGHIWKGNSWVAENTDNLYRIARWTKPIKPYQKEAIWRRLREVLPEFSRDKIEIVDGLVWNKKTCELEEHKTNTIF